MKTDGSFDLLFLLFIFLTSLGCIPILEFIYYVIFDRLFFFLKKPVLALLVIVFIWHLVAKKSVKQWEKCPLVKYALDKFVVLSQSIKLGGGTSTIQADVNPVVEKSVSSIDSHGERGDDATTTSTDTNHHCGCCHHNHHFSADVNQQQQQQNDSSGYCFCASCIKDNHVLGLSADMNESSTSQ